MCVGGFVLASLLHLCHLDFFFCVCSGGGQMAFRLLMQVYDEAVRVYGVDSLAPRALVKDLIRLHNGSRKRLSHRDGRILNSVLHKAGYGNCFIDGTEHFNGGF